MYGRFLQAGSARYFAMKAGLGWAVPRHVTRARWRDQRRAAFHGENGSWAFERKERCTAKRVRQASSSIPSFFRTMRLWSSVVEYCVYAQISRVQTRRALHDT